MSTSKHIDVICVVALVLTLLVTGLFINGKALGLAPVTDGDAGDGDSHFTANDLNGDWDTANATRITLTGDGGHVTGSGAYILDGDVHIIYAGEYVLSGELTDGSVIIDADKNDKIWLLLDGVSLHCEDSAAIIVEQAKKVFLTLADGTENFVSGGAAYSSEALSAKIDGAIYSRDDLTINGEGSLTVTAPYKHGVVCNDNLVIAGGTVNIAAAQDGVHAHDSVSFAGADLTIYAGDDGITVSNDNETAWLYIESGSITIPSCYEGLEAIDITIAGGVIDIRPTDDGINANGQGRNSIIRITGGDITVINENGRDADGFDSNGTIDISGGTIFISVNTSSYALDYGSENGGVCKISGGTIIAAGGSTMAEGFDSSSEQCFIMYNTSTAAAGTELTLKNSAGEVLLSGTIPCAFSNVVLSTPELQMGETCTISIGGTEAEVVIDNSSSSNGFGMGGMFGGGSWGGGGGMFGGRGGRGGRGMDSTEDTNGRTPNVSTLSAVSLGGRGGQQGGPGGDGSQTPGGGFDGQGGGFPGGDSGDGNMPQMPGGGFGGGKAPQMPDGDLPDGDMPQMPDGGFGGGDVPQMPDGNLPDGDMPQMPDGEPPSGELPDGDMPQVSDNGFNRGDRFTQGWPNQDQTQGGAASDAAAVSPNTFLAVGVSALFLLAGIWFAFKVKH